MFSKKTETPARYDSAGIEMDRYANAPASGYKVREYFGGIHEARVKLARWVLLKEDPQVPKEWDLQDVCDMYLPLTFLDTYMLVLAIEKLTKAIEDKK